MNCFASRHSKLTSSPHLHPAPPPKKRPTLRFAPTYIRTRIGTNNLHLPPPVVLGRTRSLLLVLGTLSYGSSVLTNRGTPERTPFPSVETGPTLRSPHTSKLLVYPSPSPFVLAESFFTSTPITHPPRQHIPRLVLHRQCISKLELVVTPQSLPQSFYPLTYLPPTQIAGRSGSYLPPIPLPSHCLST